MVDPVQLKADIQAGPLAAEAADLVAKGNDAAVADLWNQPRAAFTKSVNPVNIALVGIWAAKTGVRARLAVAAGNAASPVQGVCQTVLDFLNGLSAPPLDLANADILGMIDGLVATGVMAPGDKTSLLALQSVSPASRAEALFGAGTSVSQSDVSFALRGNR